MDEAGDIPSNIRDVISEWTYEGHSYLYDEQPANMKVLEDYLSDQSTSIDTIYRRTDWLPVLQAKIGDVIKLTRVTSWSYDRQIPDQMYEGVSSYLLILSNAKVKGIDVVDISFYKEEDEIMLAPCTVLVDDKIEDTLYVSYV